MLPPRCAPSGKRSRASGDRALTVSGPTARPRRTVVVTVAVAAMGIGWLAAGLRPDGFFAGDSELKLIAALNAIDHPLRPFQIDLPQIAGRPVPHVDTMVIAHGGHAHVLQSPIFPIISAPLIAIFGLRGAYLLPAIAFIVLMPLLNAIRKHAAPDASIGVLAFIAVAANPLLFYALEFWEHAPAVALAAGSSAAALTGLKHARPGLWMVVSGVLGGLSVVLRPEAVWYVAGLGLVLEPRRWVAFGSGIAAVLVPFALANYLHSGTPLGIHGSAGVAPLAGYFPGLWERFDAWFTPQSVPVMVGIALIAAAWMLSLANVNLARRQNIALIGAALIAVLAARQQLPRESLWQAFPVALLSLVPTNTAVGHVRRLYAVAAFSTVAILLTAIHYGGAQWGPRFLLVMSPALIVLATHGASEAMKDGFARRVRVGLVVLVLITGLAASRAAYRELRGSKRAYARVVSTTADVSKSGEVLLTNVWWFDQIAAPLYGTRTFLYAGTEQVATEIVGELTSARIDRVTLVTTMEDGGAELDGALDGTCFRIVDRRVIPERSLRFASARCGNK